MKKRILGILLVFIIAFAAVGCSSGAKTSKAYTFSVETGDSVKLSLDTSDGYDITSDVPFEISKDGTGLTQGTFIEAEMFEAYAEAAESDASATILENSTKDSNKYVFWSYNDSEFNYVILVGDSNTAVILGNAVSEESARECFNRLTISLEK